MPDDKFLNEKTDDEIKALTITLEASALRTAITIEEFIELALLQGVGEAELKAQLLEDLTEGGRIFGEFRNSVKATAAGSINRFRDAGQLSEIEVDQKFRWAAVLVNTCPDCLRRHNMMALEWEEWVAIGLPRTGQTVCKQHCKCMLVPDSDVKLNPIFRDKQKSGTYKDA